MGNAVALELGSHTSRRHFELHPGAVGHMGTALQFYAELNILSKASGCARWDKVFPSITKFTAVLCEYEEQRYCRVSVTKDDDESGIDIPLPAHRLKMTSDCFMQWRDKRYGGAWGLNFVSDKDSVAFQSICRSNRPSNGRRESLSSSASSTNTLIAPPPLEFSEGSSGSPRSPTSESDYHQMPRIRSPGGRNLSDSGIGHDTPTSPTILPSKFKPMKTTGATTADDSENGTDFIGVGGSASDIPSDMDPLEYDYLRHHAAEAEYEDTSPEASFNASNSLTASRSSLFVPNSGEHDPLVDQDAISYTRAPSAIVENRQIGATRKAGWLVVKSVLIHAKKGKVELASNRRWKKYWVALKGVELLLYQCNEKTVTDEDLDQTSHKLDIDMCLVQAIPEHAKMNNVFSLSTKYGNVYFLQSTSQVEVENWIHCILSTAATACARQRGNGGITEILANEIEKAEEKISSDGKLKKMAELQQTVVVEARSKQNIVDQITEWERCLEVLHVDLFRLRCYASSVDSSPLPNPQSILTAVSKHTKQSLVKLGLFSAASFHAYIAARQSLSGVTPKPSSRIRRGKKGGGLKAKLFDSLRIVDNAVVSAIRERHSPFPRRKQSSSTDDRSDNDSNASSSRGGESAEGTQGTGMRVQLPSNTSCFIPVEENMTVDDVIDRTCRLQNLEKDDHFLMIMSDATGLIDYVIPPCTAVIQDQKYSKLRLCKKMSYSAELDGPADFESGAFGLGVSRNSDGRVIVTSVDEASPAMNASIADGDEITKLNGTSVGNDDYLFLKLRKALRSTAPLSLELRSCRIDDPKKTRQTTESIISFLVCPPPPKTTQLDLHESALDAMIVPPPSDMNGSTDVTSFPVSPPVRDSPVANGVNIDELLSRAEEVNTITREMNALPPVAPRPTTRISPAFKLRKVIKELIDTEKTYLKNLCLLLDRYLIPMKEEEFLAKDEAEMLVGNVSEIYDFQQDFLHILEETVSADLLFEDYTEVTQFHNVVYSIGETFLEFAEKFKLYSTFCSCHSRAVKLLELDSNSALLSFLEARNPKQQHSGTLESYLITPIQRVLRYPLLMKSILKLVSEESDEERCMSDALTSVENVADYINEMQRISETFTPHFQEFCVDYVGIEPPDVSVDNLLHYGRTRWLNNPEDAKSRRSLSSSCKQKKEGDNELTVFVFRRAVILISYEQKNRKKSASPSSSVKVKTRDEIKLEILIPTNNILIRDHAWSDTDSNYQWEIVDTGDEASDAETRSSGEQVYTFVNSTGDEKKVFVNALKEASKFCRQQSLAMMAAGQDAETQSTNSAASSLRGTNINGAQDINGNARSGKKTSSSGPKPTPRTRKTSSNLHKLRSMFE